MKMKNAMRGLLGCSIVMTVGCASGQMNRTAVRQDPAPAAANVAATEYDRPGFVTELDKDGRLWVFREGSPELEAYRTSGAPARHVVRPGVGPLGLTLKAVELEVLDAYQALL